MPDLWTSINPEPVIFWAPEETSINRHVLWTSINPEPVIFWAPEETSMNRDVQDFKINNSISSALH
jgi:hypothetical protein